MLHIRVSVELYDRVARLALRADKPVTVAARKMLEQQVSRMEAVAERTGEQPV
jgi:predicted DNA-binding protein